MIFNEILNSLPERCKKVLTIDIDQVDILDGLSKERTLYCLFTSEGKERKLLDVSSKFFQKIGKEKLPFGDGEFDLVIGEEMFSHVVSLPGAFAEFRRLLKDQGLIITVEPNIQYIEFLFNLVDNKWEEVLESISSTQCHYFFTMKSFLRCAQDNGFRVEGCYPIEMGNADVFPRNQEGYIVQGRYKLGPLSNEEYIKFLTKRFVVVLSKSG